LVGEHAVVSTSAPVIARQARLRCCIVFDIRVIFPDALYYHSRSGMGSSRGVQRFIAASNSCAAAPPATAAKV
jgi:hypothetical protein